MKKSKKLSLIFTSLLYSQSSLFTKNYSAFCNKINFYYDSSINCFELRNEEINFV